MSGTITYSVWQTWWNQKKDSPTAWASIESEKCTISLIPPKKKKKEKGKKKLQKGEGKPIKVIIPLSI